MRRTAVAALWLLLLSGCSTSLPRGPLDSSHPANPAAEEALPPEPSRALAMPDHSPPIAAPTMPHHDHHGDTP